MVLVVLSALLGAAILAITLLTHGMKKMRADINRLHAELTATKIIALTQLTPAHEEEHPPKPVHRKRHLALYIGGGAVALLASVGDRLRTLAHQRRTAAVAVAATSVLVTGSAAAYYQCAGSAETPTYAAPNPWLTLPGDESIPQGSASDTPAAGRHRDTTTRPAASPSGIGIGHLGQTGVAEDDHQDRRGHGGQNRPGTGTPGEPSAPAPAPPGETEPPAPSTTPPGPTPAPTPTPMPTESSQPPATTPPRTTYEGLCILPAVLNICLGR
ncbi:hypothetical protein QFZ66_005819 [Streptomyces sp. B4I13]|nr:hypothetical protein [Streptomyces sp. B4I13]